MYYLFLLPVLLLLLLIKVRGGTAQKGGLHKYMAACENCLTSTGLLRTLCQPCDGGGGDWLVQVGGDWLVPGTLCQVAAACSQENTETM